MTLTVIGIVLLASSSFGMGALAVLWLVFGYSVWVGEDEC